MGEIMIASYLLKLLSKFYGEKKMVCTSMGFPQLENLEFEWEEWKDRQVEEGATMMLKSQVIIKAMYSQVENSQKVDINVYQSLSQFTIQMTSFVSQIEAAIGIFCQIYSREDK